MTEDGMARVYFMRDFDYKPTPQRLYVYPAGTSHTVKRECATLAIAAGAAIEEKPPSRPRADKPRPSPPSGRRSKPRVD